MSFQVLNFKKILAIFFISIACAYRFANPMEINLGFDFHEEKSAYLTEELADRFLKIIELKGGYLEDNDKLFIKNKLKATFANDALTLEQDLNALSENPKLLEEFTKNFFETFEKNFSTLLSKDVFIPASTGMVKLDDLVKFSSSDKIVIMAGLISFIKQKAKSSKKICSGKLKKTGKVISAGGGFVLFWVFFAGIYQLVTNTSLWPKVGKTLFVSGSIVVTLLFVLYIFKMLPKSFQDFVSPTANVKKLVNFCGYCKKKKKK